MGTRRGDSLACFQGSHFPRKGPTAVIRLARGVHSQQMPAAHTLPQHASTPVFRICPWHPHAQGSTEAQDGAWSHSCPLQQAGHTDKGLSPTDQPVPESQGDKSQHTTGTPKQRRGAARERVTPQRSTLSGSGGCSGLPGPGGGGRPDSCACVTG